MAEDKMRKGCYAFGLFVAVVWTIGLPKAESQEPASGGVAVHMVVTAEAHHGKEVPDVHKDDVMVYQGRERRQVADWTPLREEHAALQLFILLDDSSHVSVASQFEEIRNFINSQPPTTAIGIGYMRDGTVDITQNLTTEHALAAKALRLPVGHLGAYASIYLSIGDLIKRWLETPVRREVLAISDGIDYFGGVGPANPYVDAAIEQAQKAGVLIYAIYATGVGHYGHSVFRMNWGQNYLSEMAEETGGEAYFLGFETPVSFAPYLDDLSQRLTHQYLLVFQARPEKKPGLQSVRLRTELPNVELAAADKVFVPAEK
jgi:VWFA-related protein